MRGSRSVKKNASVRTSGSIPSETAIRPQRRNKTGCAGLRRAEPTVWKFSERNSRLSEPSSSSATLIFLPKLPIRLMKNAGRSRSSCGFINPPANSMRPGYRMTTPLSGASFATFFPQCSPCLCSEGPLCLQLWSHTRYRPWY